MSTRTQLSPAMLIPLGLAAPLMFMFNPDQLSFSYEVKWNQRELPGRTVPKMRYAGGKASDFTVTAVFDSTNEPAAEMGPSYGFTKGSDLRTVSVILMSLTRPVPILTNEPPTCIFTYGPWGPVYNWLDMWAVVIKRVEEKWTQFAPNGNVVHLEMNITMQRRWDPLSMFGTNPTSGGAQGERVHVVTEGETLEMIAYREYQDLNAWRHLAETNKIDDPRRVEPGTVLVITPRKQRHGRR